MKIVVTGGRGQLGRALARRATDHELLALDRAALDISNRDSIARVLDELKPDVVVNAAAYTAVDRAESERELAFAINAAGAGNVARECAARGVRLLHVSTDFVFDGTTREPHREDDRRAPLGAYGDSKAGGEDEVRVHGGIVVRTAWVFAAGGNGFVQAILRAARDRPVLGVVADQIGSPTWADDLADALVALAAKSELAPIYHYVGEPAASRHAFAEAIVEAARKHAPIACERVEPIATAERPASARRPPYAVLATDRIRALGIVPRPWRDGLARVVAEELAR